MLISNIGMSLGQDFFSSIEKTIFPKPEWILTDYAEQRLSEIGKLDQLKSDYEDLSKKTDEAYQNIIGKSFSDVSMYLLIGAVVIVILLFIKK